MKCTMHYPESSTLSSEQRGPKLDLFEGVWPLAADDYAAEYLGKRAVGEKTPKGMQRHINAVIHNKLIDDGWDGIDGRYHKDDHWLRVTFRHEMSLGSDLLDALRMYRVEGFRRISLIAATPTFLRLISPSDCNSLCSSDDFRAQIKQNEFLFDIPFGLGTLEPESAISPDVAEVLSGKR